MGFKNGRTTTEIVDELTTEHGPRGAIFYMVGVVEAVEEQTARYRAQIDDLIREVGQLREAEAERSDYPVDVRLVDVTAERDEYERAFKELRKVVEQTLPCDRGR